MPKVSICTAVLNQSDLLRKNIESVLAQSFTDWEHIIVDDGSTEDIQAVVDRYNDPRHRYERLDQNIGSRRAYNYAFTLTRGEYVGLLSADEFIWDKKLEVQVPWMDDHPLIGCTWGLPTPNQGKPWDLGEAQGWEQYVQLAHNRSREAWIRTLLQLENIPIGGASMLMRRECMQTIGEFDEDLSAVSDLEWFVRFFQHYQGWILPYRLADAVHPESRLSAQATTESFNAELKLLREKHKLVLPPTAGRVTVAMPVRNMEKYVSASIQSVLDQTFPGFDLIILDDASTDGTVAEIQKFTDPRIKLFKVEDNIGVPAAQNQMLASATTEFFTLLAADDVLAPTALERLLAEFKKQPFLEFVASQTDFIDADGKTTTTSMFEGIPKASNKGREEWLRQLYYGNHYFGVGMVRTAVALDLGGWDSTMGVICDYEMYLKLLQRENIQIIEEPLIHTRAHEGQRSILKTWEDQQVLRKNYSIAKRRYYQPRARVIIATPFYEMRGFSPYIVSLTGTINLLTKMGIEHDYWELSGDSYVDRAKNTIFNKFLEDPDATDLFMIDSDMQWEPKSFIRMLQFPEDIVMGSYPQKNMWGRFTALPRMEMNPETKSMDALAKFYPDGASLIQADYLAGGFIRIKRSCLEKYKENFKDFVYQDQGADPGCPDRIYTEFFTCERAVGPTGEGGMLRWGEDRVFGKRMKAIGVDSWIYPNANLGHYGIKGWMGNYEKFLKEGVQVQ